MTATAPSLTETHTPRRRVAALERRIAVRYLKGRKSSGLASLSTMIATGGVVVGVAALLVVLGVMNGLRDDLREKILVGNPHLHLLTYGANLRMDHWREVLEKVRKDPEVVAASPGVLVKSLALNNANYPAAVDVVGLDPDTTKGSATALPKAITQGDLSFHTRSDSVEGGVILGYRLADRLSTYVGDQLTLLSAADARVNRALGRPTPRFWRFEVTGIFNTGMYEYDDGFAVMRLDQAQRFAGLGNAVSGIQIRLKDPWRAREVGKRLEDSLGYPYRSLAWQDQNATLFGALQLEKLGMGLIICFIMLVAAFNIVGTLTMVVTDKTREIGILLAMGLTPRSISRIFRAQGAVIGVVGTALGLGLGLLLAYLIDTSGIIRINPEIYFIDHLPVHIQVFDVLAVAAISLLVALLATLPASRSAARLQPVDAIRHE